MRAGVGKIGLPALALLVCSLLTTLWLEMQPQAGGPLGVLFPPWRSQQESFLAAAAAGATIVRTGPVPTMIVLASPTPELAKRLHAAGAWLLFNPIALGGCLQQG